MDNKTGIFLQVRLNSSRMPGKAILNLAGKYLVQHTIERLSVVPADVRVILTTKESEGALKGIAESNGWELFCGDAQNVLKRYVDAALFFDVDTVVRATGDNPLTSSEIAMETISEFVKGNADLAHIAPAPYGSGVEVVKRSALIRALENASLPYEFEHVTPYIYNHKNEFKVITTKYHSEKISREDIKISVDTRDDYERVNFFVKKLAEKKLNMTIESIIELWDEVDFSSIREILFVVSAGGQWGFGHLQRMFLLAEKLLPKFRIVFLLKCFDDKAEKLVKEKGYAALSYAEVQEKINTKGPYDRVIVDIRDTSTEDMEIYKTFGPVFSFDDMGEGVQSAFCSVKMLPALDSDLKFNFEGIEYLFLDPKLKKKSNTSHKIKKILVTFGGSDPARLTNKVLELITDKGFEITAIVGPFFQEKTQEYADVEKVFSPKSLVEFIDDADLVITSFGMTFMESLYTNTPVLIINPSDYHNKLTKKFKYPFLISKLSELSFGAIKEKITAIETNKEQLQFFYNLPFGEKVDYLIEVIDKSSPAVPLCQGCCSVNTDLVYRSNKWNMFHCNKCGLFYIETFLPNKNTYADNYFLTEYKQQYGRTYEEDREKIRKLAVPRLKIISKYVKNGTLLDFGAGLGFFAEYANENGFSPVCYDISEYACSYIKEKLKINSKCGNQSLLEKNSDKFDVITSFYVIEHVNDFKKLLFLFAAHLRKNGVLALATPNGSGYSIKKKFSSYAEKHPDDHVFIFTPALLKNELKKLGFRKIKTRITGIHPERMVKSKFLLNNKFFLKLIMLYAGFFKLGDTFEIYAQKN
ncbi:MAG: methyltransferase domain-containing protein [Spirochaetales bacterium]|nr:methyltransferase domain-containing protein [Spirochaetales bacterium]